MPLKILIIEAYTKNGRARTVDVGASLPASLFERAIREHCPDANIDIVAFDSASPDLPGDLSTYDGVVWTGSNLTIHRRNELIDAQIDLARALFDAGTPQFGCCYGLQLATVAAGGTVETNPNGPEIAWARDVHLTSEGRSHPMFDGKDDHFDALCWHYDTATQLPDDAVLLAGNENSAVQAAILKRNGAEFWATQYHLEFDGFEVARMLSGNADGLVQRGDFESEEELTALSEEMDRLKALERDPDDMPPTLIPVVDPKIRTAEIGNWLASLPHHS